MQNKEQDSSSQVGSWGRFARRMYVTNGHARTQRYSQTPSDPKDTVWLYVAISIVYFSLIGLVLLILLFAPKFRPPSLHEYPDVVTAETQDQPQIPETVDESRDFIATESNFEASPKDPIYHIDPRSSIFRGDVYDDFRRQTESRMRLNSKFLQV